MLGLPRLATSYSAGKNVEKSLSNNFRFFSQNDNFVKVSFKKKNHQYRVKKYRTFSILFSDALAFVMIYAYNFACSVIRLRSSLLSPTVLSLEGQSMLYNRLVVLRSIAVSDLSGENSWKS